MPKIDGNEAGYVLKTIQSMRTTYESRVRIMKHIRRVRALRIQTRTPRSFQKLLGHGVRSPLPWTLVQTINGRMAKNAPRFYRESIEPKGRDADAKLAATCWPLLQTYSRMARSDLFYKICDQLVGDGMSVTKLRRITDPNYPQQEDKEKSKAYDERLVQYVQSGRGKSPLRLSVIDPATFWPDREEEPNYVVESGKRALLPTMQALRLMKGTNNSLIDMPSDMPSGPTFSWDMIPDGAGGGIDVDEVWTPEACYYHIGGSVFKYPNEFGFIPYSWRFGMQTSIPDPTLEAVSTIFPFYAIDPYINTVLTNLISWSIMTGMPTAVIETDPKVGSGGEQATTDLPLGQMVELAPGKTFKYALPPSGFGSEAVAIINMFMSFYDKSGVTEAARGVVGSRMPGLTLTTAFEASDDLFIPVKTSLQGMMEDVVVMTWKAVEKLNTPIAVTGQAVESLKNGKKPARHIIKPSMIKGYHDIHCIIEPMSDQALTQRGMHAAFMKDKQLWGSERAMIFAGVDNPAEERIEMAADQLRMTPLYQRQMMEQAFAEDAVAQEMVEQDAAQGIDSLGLEDFSDQVQPEGGAPPTAPAGGQIRGLGAPASGGRPAGSARRPTGPQPGQYNQGNQTQR